MSELEKIERRSGKGVVVRGDDIDTDQIIPARYMRSVSFTGLEDGVFADVRRNAEGEMKGHPFDDVLFDGASILVVNRNFGCGSSREHAPQALMRWGIRAMVGESFAEIFFGNCTAMGIPVVVASRDDVAALMDAIELDPGHEVTVDLVAETITSRAGTQKATIPKGARAQLIEGTWDAMRTLLVAKDVIRSTADALPYIRGF